MRMKVFENSSHKRTRSDPRKTLWIVVSVTANFLTTHPPWLWFIPTSTRRQEKKSIFPTNQHQHAQKRPPAFKESKRKKTPKSTALFFATKIRLFPPHSITGVSSQHKTLLLRYLNAARQQREKQQRILYLLASGTKRPG